MVSVVLLQANGDRTRKIALEVEDIPDIGPAPAVDGLVLITHHADILAVLGEQTHELVLAAVGVLILIHHDEFVAAVEALAGLIVVGKQAHGFEQQVVEVKRIRFAQASLITFINSGEPGGGRVGGCASHVLGRLLVAFGVADARERGAMLHELVVQAHASINRLEHRDLVVVVVDRKQRGEAGTQGGQRRAIAAQEADAEGVKGRDRGRTLGSRRNQRANPIPHFARGLVGEGDRQDRPAGDTAGGHQVSHAMGDDPGLPAARTG